MALRRNSAVWPSPASPSLYYTMPTLRSTLRHVAMPSLFDALLYPSLSVLCSACATLDAARPKLDTALPRHYCALPVQFGSSPCLHVSAPDPALPSHFGAMLCQRASRLFLSVTVHNHAFPVLFCPRLFPAGAILCLTALCLYPAPLRHASPRLSHALHYVAEPFPHSTAPSNAIAVLF